MTTRDVGVESLRRGGLEGSALVRRLRCGFVETDRHGLRIKGTGSREASFLRNPILRNAGLESCQGRSWFKKLGCVGAGGPVS
jgi:hypothetical protein